MPPETTVLVVEREPQVRRLLREILLRDGYSVLEARNGEAALRFCRVYTGELHALITDDQYPELLEIARLHPGLKLVTFTGATPLLAAASRVVKKPFTPQDILEALRALLGPDESATPAT